jgi:hypothetical protein
MEGLKSYRHISNPQEKVFHDTFIKDYNTILATSQIVKMVDGKGDPKEYTTDEERNLMVTTIQWLGSPVGQGFLNKCGFELKKEEK